MKPDPLPQAIRNLGICRIFRHNGTIHKLACLLRDEDTRPLHAPWWKGKESSIIAADLSGNFFLRHCDGTVRYWNHATQTDTVVATSVRSFVSGLEPDHEI